MNKYREAVLKNIPKELDSFNDLLTMGALGLAGETGEVVDMIKKYRFQKRGLDHHKLLLELGDVRWYMEIILDTLNSNMREIEEMNIEKLKKRYPNGFEVKK